MPYTLTMPKLSPTMESGTVVKWHKKVGEHVEPGDILLEVSTDKATVEHNALDGGWLREILIAEGSQASVNQPIAIFTEEKTESLEGYKPEAVISSVKEKVQFEEPVLEGVKIESSKCTQTKGLSQPAFIPEPPLDHYEFQFPTDAMDKRIKASPLAKKLAKERKLDLTTVKGTGPGGRIVQEDLEKAQKSGVVVFGKREIPSQAPGSYEELPLNPIQKIVSQRLQESKTFIPHFYVSQAINAEALWNTREQLNAAGIVLSYNDFVVRACALSLREHPHINSGFNSETYSIIRFKTIDISVAVSIKDGLITPIIRHADYKNLGEISVEIRYLAKKAREGKLTLQEFKGGSFTISNLGMYGVTDFQAIINPPQGAILAVSGIQNVPVVKNGSVVAGKVMNVTLSVDHRVIDGVLAAEFIKTVQKHLENPAILLV